MELGQVAGMLLFFGGFMGVVVAVNAGIRWANRRFPSETRTAEALEHVEHRLAEIEERLDAAEQMLADVRRQQLPG